MTALSSPQSIITDVLASKTTMQDPSAQRVATLTLERLKAEGYTIVSTEALTTMVSLTAKSFGAVLREAVRDKTGQAQPGEAISDMMRRGVDALVKLANQKAPDAQG